MADSDDAVKLALFALRATIDDRDWDATEAAFDALIARMKERDKATCTACDHDEWIHNLHDDGRCIPECGCALFTTKDQG